MTRPASVPLALVTLALLALLALALLGPSDDRPSSLTGSDPARGASADASLETGVGDGGASRSEDARRASIASNDTGPSPSEHSTVGTSLRVIDGVTGLPVAGAVVAFLDESERADGDGSMEDRRRVSWREKVDGRGTRRTTDESGRVGVPQRTRLVVARHEADGVVRIGSLRLDWAAPRQLELALFEREPWRVSVVDEAGAPVVGIPVVMFDFASQRLLDRRRTDAQGLVRFDRIDPLPAGVELGPEDTRPYGFALDAVLARARFTYAEVEAPAGDTLQLVCPPTGAIDVVVGEGPPILPGETLGLCNQVRDLRLRFDPRYRPCQAKPLRRGVTRFEFVEVGQRLHVVMDELGVRTEEVVTGPVTPGEVVRVHLDDWLPEPVVEGRVLDESGAPFVRRRLELLLLGTRGWVDGSDDSASIVTDNDGRFRAPRRGFLLEESTLVLEDPEGLGRSAPFFVGELDLEEPARVGDIVVPRRSEWVRGVVTGHGGALADAELDFAVVRAAPAWSVEEHFDVHRQIVNTLADDEADRIDADHEQIVVRERAARSAGDGTFAAAVPADAEALVVRVRAPGHEPLSRLVERPFDAPLVLDLQPRFRLRGQLVGLGATYPAWSVAPIARCAGVELDIALERDGNFEVEARSDAPIDLLLTSPVAPERVFAEVRGLAPSLDGERHPQLDPLDVRRFVDVFQLTVTPPFLGDEQPSTAVVVVDEEGEIWAQRGASSGPWRFNLAVPQGWGRELTVRTNCYRPVTVRHNGSDLAVELELGPPLALTFEQLAVLPEGASLGYSITAEDTRSVRTDEAGQWLGHLAEPGRCTVAVLLAVPRRIDGNDRHDARWNTLANRRIVLTELDVPAAGLTATVTVPDLEGLLELARPDEHGEGE